MSTIDRVAVPWLYLWQETRRGLRRGGWMNWAAIGTVAVSLFLFGISLQGTWYLDRALAQLGSQLEIAVYLKPNAQTAQVAEAIAQLDGVVGVQTISKDQAWQDLVRDLGISDIARATQQLEGNPLTDELKAKAARADLTPQLAAQMAKIPGVDTARYAAEVVVRLRELDWGLKVVATGTIVLLVSAAIATIVTAIRLIVAARCQEIEIAQLVGALPVWIYLPFILQGMVFGIQGASIASVAVVALQQALGSLLNSRLGLVQLLARDLPLDWNRLLLLLLILVGFGCSVGLVGSYVAVRRTTSELALKGTEFEV